MKQFKKNYTSESLAISMQHLVDSEDYQHMFKLIPKIKTASADSTSDATVAEQIVEVFLRTSEQLEQIGLVNSSIRVLQAAEVFQKELEKLANDNFDNEEDEIYSDDLMNQPDEFDETDLHLGDHRISPLDLPMLEDEDTFYPEEQDMTNLFDDPEAEFEDEELEDLDEKDLDYEN